MIEISFTSPTGEIGIDGSLPLSYECSGTVYAGQGVVLCGTRKVKAPGGDPAGLVVSGCVGVAEYKQTDGEWVAVYGPGARVNVIVSGTGTLLGHYLQPGGEGKFAYRAEVGPCSGNVTAIALETQATNVGTCSVLLV